MDIEISGISTCKECIYDDTNCFRDGKDCQMQAIETVLNLIAKQKAEIEDKQDEINVLEAQRDSIENQFEQAKAEIEKKDRIIDEMAEWIEKHTKYYDEDGCYCEVEKDICNKNIECEDCIKEYFTKKVEEDK